MAEDAIVTQTEDTKAQVAEAQATAPETVGELKESTASFTPTAITEREREVILADGTTKITLKKLKAGPYYEAQQVFTQWMSYVQKLTNMKSKGEDLVSPDGEIDTTKVKTMVAESVDAEVEELLDVVKKIKDSQLALVGHFIGKSKKDVADEFYHEDVEVILWNGIRLNNFINNLKK